MPKFVLAYHGQPKIESNDEGAQHMVEWRAWMEALGDAVVEPGVPVGPSITIHSDGTVTDDGGANPISGYTILEADDIEAAIKMAKPCPHIKVGGSIEIAPALNMEM
ncbi:YciI family protein [Sneathiella sp.]|jgi:hypothetical protein|uniref:YciI family protein n=1 Tax=Sneathiella sp. TaxID=1964365 RepID=UPI0039E5E9BC